MSETEQYLTTAAALKAFYTELTEDVEMPESVVHALMAEAGHCLMAGDGQLAVRRSSHV